MTYKVDVPNGSIYLWMYTQGLKGVPLEQVIQACHEAGVSIRDKDLTNYNNGVRNRGVYSTQSTFTRTPVSSTKDYYDLKYSDYPLYPYTNEPEISNRWVPCSYSNKPMIKWSEGCMSKEAAELTDRSKYLAENIYNTHMIVIDCDGDHDDSIDLETIELLWQFADKTHCMRKPKDCIDYDPNVPMEFWDKPASFHLTFMVDRIIPTMHFPSAHIDIIGNKRNSLRYFKNKKWNKLPLLQMNDDIWETIKRHVERREQS